MQVTILALDEENTCTSLRPYIRSYKPCTLHVAPITAGVAATAFVHVAHTKQDAEYIL